jgi:hypothetical protein
MHRQAVGFAVLALRALMVPVARSVRKLPAVTALVAKEFVASRPDEDGVLVLSEFAGAAAELSEALLVNPYDIEETSEVFYRALTMPPDERHTRMAIRRQRVMTYDGTLVGAHVRRAARARRRPDRREPRPVHGRRVGGGRGARLRRTNGWRCSSTTTAPSSRSPRRPNWQCPTPISSRSCGGCPHVPAPKCTS